MVPLLVEQPEPHLPTVFADTRANDARLAQLHATPSPSSDGVTRGAPNSLGAKLHPQMPRLVRIFRQTFCGGTAQCIGFPSKSQRMTHLGH
jgi:hypothetical protein